MSQTKAELHDGLIREAAAAEITVKDLARAWASIDGKRDEFDIGAQPGAEIEDGGGHYAGYVCEAEELLRRATVYANARNN